MENLYSVLPSNHNTLQTLLGNPNEKIPKLL